MRERGQGRMLRYMSVPSLRKYDTSFSAEPYCAWCFPAAGAQPIIFLDSVTPILARGGNNVATHNFTSRPLFTNDWVTVPEAAKHHLLAYTGTSPGS